MKSRITIEMDFNSLEPVIQVDARASDDVRDKLIQVFFEKLKGESTSLRVGAPLYLEDGLVRRKIYAVEPDPDPTANIPSF